MPPTMDTDPLELKPPNPLLRPIGIIFTIIIALIFGLIVSIGGWDRQPNSDNSDLLPNTSTQNPVNNSCGTVAEEEVTSCCSQWAINNDVVLPQCVGSWNISDNQCNWVCSNDGEGI